MIFQQDTGGPSDLQDGLASGLVQTDRGWVQGIMERTGICSFKGIPFAEPPVGSLRWRPPQKPRAWQGVRKADQFGPRPMQLPLFGDMSFRSAGMSEDCLYLNVWTSARSGRERLPVLVYFYGGALQAGDAAEGRYDGESMARRGIVVVTVNYRLNVFGFLSHPELTNECSEHSSGNYGLLDQWAALQWVQRNISAFGGDPEQVTIAGESAGSISVSAHMASSRSRGLFARALGESGSLMGALTPVPLGAAEATGGDWAKRVGLHSLLALRAAPAERLLQGIQDPSVPWFALVVDGYFLERDPILVYAAGAQARVPLLVGWNSEEMNYRAVLGTEPCTVHGFEAAVRRLYPSRWMEALKSYRAQSDNEVIQAATDLASDRFIAFSTWRWAEFQRRMAVPVYRYYYNHPRPAMRPEVGNAAAGLAGGVIPEGMSGHSVPAPTCGAAHSAEIEYALGNLDRNSVYAWAPEDYAVSETLQSYFANFIKAGDPNGPGLVRWPALTPAAPAEFLEIGVECSVHVDAHAERYQFLERVESERRA